LGTASGWLRFAVVLVDRSGIVRWTYLGELEEAVVLEEIRALL